MIFIKSVYKSISFQFMVLCPTWLDEVLVDERHRWFLLNLIIMEQRLSSEVNVNLSVSICSHAWNALKRFGNRRSEIGGVLSLI